MLSARTTSAAGASVRDSCMVNPRLRIIIDALRCSVRKFIVFPIWFGYDQRKLEDAKRSRGEQNDVTRGHQVRSRPGRGKGGQPQQGSGGRGGERGVRRDRRQRG